MSKQRAFLKWAGGKYSLVEEINKRLPKGSTLVEPFVGAGSVFLNTEFERYILSDINPDLINLYQTVKENPHRYLEDVSRLFNGEHNNRIQYMQHRAEFNQSTDAYQRSILFLYLNRFGFNGLCRYNKKGIFNVPFGSYKKPYFPEKEILAFSEKAQQAEFYCEDFRQTFKRVQHGHIVYCDPPYVGLSKTADFTTYAKGGFDAESQAELAQLAEDTAREKQTSVLLSNHSTHLTRRLYRGAQIEEIRVARNISRDGTSRKKVSEILALFS